MLLMQKKLLYEYAVIRIVPRVERGEFINVGVILFCRDAKFLKMKYEVNSKKLLALNPKADIDKLDSLMHAFEKICCGETKAGSIAGLKMADRFRWLTAQRSTMIQVSEVHPGLANDPEKKLEQLFEQLVL